MGNMPEDRLQKMKDFYAGRSRHYMQPWELRFMMGVEYEELVKAQTGGDLTVENLSTEQKNHLMFAYRLQGRYEEAIPYAVDRADRLQLNLLMAAREISPKAFCSCPIAPVEEEKVWSVRHDGFVSLYKCPTCSAVIITDMSIKEEYLKQQMKLKAQAEASVKREKV